MASLPQATGNRLVLIRLAPPKIGCKLCLVPASRIKDGRLLPIPPFDKLLEQFREAWRKGGHTDFLFAFGQYERLSKGRLRLGSIYITSQPDKSPASRRRYELHFHPDEFDYEEFRAFHELATEAGLHLPPEAKDALDHASPTTPFAWWIAAITAYGSAGQPLDSQRVSGVKLPQFVLYTGLFEQSVRTIERCEHLSPRLAGLAKGHWSAALSKAEIARRILGKRTTTRTQETKALHGLEIQQFTDADGKPRSKLWIVRLDGLPDDVRERLTTP